MPYLMIFPGQESGFREPGRAAHSAKKPGLRAFLNQDKRIADPDEEHRSVRRKQP